MSVAEPVPTTLFGRLGEPAADAARTFLQRNGVAMRWVDVERDPIAGLLSADSFCGMRLPLTMFPNGTRLEGLEHWASRRAPTRQAGTAERPGTVDRESRRHYRQSRRWMALGAMDAAIAVGR